jgi:hypothetical protein
MKGTIPEAETQNWQYLRFLAGVAQSDLSDSFI